MLTRLIKFIWFFLSIKYGS